MLEGHYSTHDRGLQIEEAPGSLCNRFTVRLAPVGTNAKRLNCPPKPTRYQPRAHKPLFPALSGTARRFCHVLTSFQYPLVQLRSGESKPPPCSPPPSARQRGCRPLTPGRAWPSLPCASLCVYFPKCTKEGDAVQPNSANAASPRDPDVRCASPSRGLSTSFSPGNHLPTEHPQPGSPQSALRDMPH